MTGNRTSFEIAEGLPRGSRIRIDSADATYVGMCRVHPTALGSRLGRDLHVEITFESLRLPPDAGCMT